MSKQISIVFENDDKIDDFEIIKKITELIRLAKLNLKLIGVHVKLNQSTK